MISAESFSFLSVLKMKSCIYIHSVHPNIGVIKAIEALCQVGLAQAVKRSGSVQSACVRTLSPSILISFNSREFNFYPPFGTNVFHPRSQHSFFSGQELFNSRSQHSFTTPVLKGFIRWSNEKKWSKSFCFISNYSIFNEDLTKNEGNHHEDWEPNHFHSSYWGSN